MPPAQGTIEAFMAQAQQMAASFIQMPEQQMEAELSKIKATDQNLAFQIAGIMAHMKQKAGTTGRQLLRQGQIPPQI